MKIILVEDDLFFQQFYTFKLQQSGYEIISAGDGEDGLIKIRSEHPDLILLDLIMPKKTGFEVLEELQKDITVSEIPVLVFSTLGQEKDQEKALQLGARGYVDKSFFDFSTLLEKIQALKPV